MRRCMPVSIARHRRMKEARALIHAGDQFSRFRNTAAFDELEKWIFAKLYVQEPEALQSSTANRHPLRLTQQGLRSRTLLRCKQTNKCLQSIHQRLTTTNGNLREN